MFGSSSLTITNSSVLSIISNTATAIAQGYGSGITLNDTSAFIITPTGTIVLTAPNDIIVNQYGSDKNVINVIVDDSSSFVNYGYIACQLFNTSLGTPTTSNRGGCTISVTSTTASYNHVTPGMIYTNSYATMRIQSGGIHTGSYQVGNGATLSFVPSTSVTYTIPLTFRYPATFNQTSGTWLYSPQAIISFGDYWVYTSTPLLTIRCDNVMFLGTTGNRNAIQFHVLDNTVLYISDDRVTNMGYGNMDNSTNGYGMLFYYDLQSYIQDATFIGTKGMTDLTIGPGSLITRTGIYIAQTETFALETVYLGCSLCLATFIHCNVHFYVNSGIYNILGSLVLLDSTWYVHLPLFYFYSLVSLALYHC
jgi:hypothetical protein